MNIGNIKTRLLVRDFGLMYDFFTQKLGMETHWGDRENGIFASFREPGGKAPVIAIFLKERMSEYEGYGVLPGEGRPDSQVLTIGSDDLDEDYRVLKEKGVDLLGEPRAIEAWYMRCVFFRDPEGNLYEISGDLG